MERVGEENSEPSSGGSKDIVSLASIAVDSMLTAAKTLIASDPAGYFLYKYPTEQDHRPLAGKSKAAPKTIAWSTIGYFNLHAVVRQIRDFIATWKLSPGTKCVLTAKEGSEGVQGLGKRYFVDVLFSKPTADCPEPTAVAVVHFAIHISALLPKHYPIMVTYRFGGSKTEHYTIGPKSVLQSRTFQRDIINSIIDVPAGSGSIAECPETKNTEVSAKEVDKTDRPSVKDDCPSIEGIIKQFSEMSMAPESD